MRLAAITGMAFLMMTATSAQAGHGSITIHKQQVNGPTKNLHKLTATEKDGGRGPVSGTVHHDTIQIKTKR